jgi:hypothetical protein
MSSLERGEHSFAASACWYNGYVFAVNPALLSVDDPLTHRGLNVFEIDHAALGKALTPHLNAETQEELPT